MKITRLRAVARGLSLRVSSSKVTRCGWVRSSKYLKNSKNHSRKLNRSGNFWPVSFPHPLKYAITATNVVEIWEYSRLSRRVQHRKVFVLFFERIFAYVSVGWECQKFWTDEDYVFFICSGPKYRIFVGHIRIQLRMFQSFHTDNNVKGTAFVLILFPHSKFGGLRECLFLHTEVRSR